jgi:hypothetical protein
MPEQMGQGSIPRRFLAEGYVDVWLADLAADAI